MDEINSDNAQNISDEDNATINHFNQAVPSPPLNSIEQKKIELEVAILNEELKVRRSRRSWIFPILSALSPFIIAGATIFIAFYSGAISVEVLKRKEEELKANIKKQEDSISVLSRVYSGALLLKDSLIRTNSALTAKSEILNGELNASNINSQQQNSEKYNALMQRYQRLYDTLTKLRISLNRTQIIYRATDNIFNESRYRPIESSKRRADGGSEEDDKYIIEQALRGRHR